MSVDLGFREDATIEKNLGLAQKAWIGNGPYPTTAVGNQSGQTGKLAVALAKAQANFKAVNKSKTAKVKGKTADGRLYEYEYKYADLADILGMALPALSAQGIAFSQPLRRRDGKLFVITRLEFENESREDDGLMVPEAVKPAELGSYLTFYRRYGVSTNLGISTEEDADAPQETVIVTPNKPSASEQPKTEVKRERPTKLVTSVAPGTTQITQTVTVPSSPDSPVGNIHGVNITDSDLPNFDDKPTPEERKAFRVRLQPFIALSSTDKVKAFVNSAVGLESTTSLTKSQWENVLGKLDAAKADNSLEKLLG